MKHIVEFSNDEQTQILNRILSNDKDKYSLYDIFENLPFDITYNGKRGYLNISNTGITYTSISYDNKLNIVFVENTDHSSTNIFGCFLNTLQWLRKNENNITINFWN